MKFSYVLKSIFALNAHYVTTFLFSVITPKNKATYMKLVSNFLFAFILQE